MLAWEKKAYLEGSSLIIGVDEAGRGPLAGPVVAAACTLRPFPLKSFSFPIYKERIDDSKKISPKKRAIAFSEIRRHSLFGLGIKSHNFIDRKNIHRATLKAMKEAVNSLIKKFCILNNKKEAEIRNKTCVLVDGNMDPGLNYKTIKIIEGDSKSLSIAAASIIAKVTRDRIMDRYDRSYPLYRFKSHKGYATKFHIDALDRFGPSPIHRRTFYPVKEIIQDK